MTRHKNNANNYLGKIVGITFFLFLAHGVRADTIVDGGAVDYSMGAEGLYNMTEYVLVMMHYVTMVLYAIASITAIVDSLQICIKMNNQEGDVSKHILRCFGACLYLTVATFVLPSFFGVVQSDSMLFEW